MVKRFRSFNLPWVALGGGGYDPDNVKRAWTLAWAIMNEVEDRENLIELRDKPLKEKISNAQRKSVEEAIMYLKKEVLDRENLIELRDKPLKEKISKLNQ